MQKYAAPLSGLVLVAAVVYVAVDSHVHANDAFLFHNATNNRALSLEFWNRSFHLSPAAPPAHSIAPTFPAPTTPPTFPAPTAPPTFPAPTTLPTFAAPTALPTFPAPTALPTFLPPTAAPPTSSPSDAPALIAPTTSPSTAPTASPSKRPIPVLVIAPTMPPESPHHDQPDGEPSLELAAWQTSTIVAGVLLVIALGCCWAVCIARRRHITSNDLTTVYEDGIVRTHMKRSTGEYLTEPVPGGGVFGGEEAETIDINDYHHDEEWLHPRGGKRVVVLGAGFDPREDDTHSLRRDRALRFDERVQLGAERLWNAFPSMPAVVTAGSMTSLRSTVRMQADEDHTPPPQREAGVLGRVRSFFAPTPAFAHGETICITNPMISVNPRYGQIPSSYVEEKADEPVPLCEETTEQAPVVPQPPIEMELVDLGEDKPPQKIRERARTEGAPAIVRFDLPSPPPAHKEEALTPAEARARLDEEML